MDNEISKGVVIRSLIWKYLERSSVQLIHFCITIVLARLLMPSEYGIIALIMVFVNIFQVIVDGGFNTALIQKKNADNVDFSTIFFFGLMMSALMYGILFFAAPLIASFYSQIELVPIIRVIGVVLFLHAIVAIQNSYVSRNMLFRKLFVCSLVSVLISGVVGIAMAYWGYGVWALVAQTIIAQLSLAIIMWFRLKWRPEMIFSYNRLKGMLDYGWKIFTTNIIVALFVNIRKLIIGRFYTPASLAYFERGEQFPNLIMTNINSSIQAVMFPTFAKVQKDRVKVKQILRRATKMSCFIIYPLMVLLIVMAKPLILLLLTEKWLPAVAFMQIFCIANLFRPITLANLEAIKALGYSNISLKLEVIKKVVDVSILIISVFFGVYAIAWGIVLFNFICVFINLAPNKKLLNYGIHEQIIDAAPTLLTSLVMGVSVYWIQLLTLPNIVILILQTVLGFIVYIGISGIIKEESFMYILQNLKEKGYIVNR